MSEDKNTNLFSNAKLSTIFLVVLGLHIVVIVLISAYHLLKGDTTMEMAETIESTPPAGYESVFSDDKEAVTPQVETVYTPERNSQGNSQSGMPPMSMPAADDPIWTGDSPVKPAENQLAGRYDSSLPEPVFAPVKKTMETRQPEVSSPAPAPASALETSIYTVQRGDTLSRIAAKNNMSVSELQKLNQLNSTLIRVGQKLQVSGTAAANDALAAPRVAQAPPRAQPVGTGKYEVAKGDTLWRIAQRFDTTPQELARLNGIADPSKLRVGDTLKVPTGAGPVGSGQETDMAMAP